MKNLFFILAFSLLSGGLTAQIWAVSNFNTNVSGAANTELDCSGTCTNNDCCSPINITQIIQSTNLPAGWTCTMCNPNGCHGTSVTQNTFVIPNSSNRPFSFKINANGIVGTGTVTVRMQYSSSDYQDYTITATASTTTGVDDVQITEVRQLSQNYPNPFTESTTIDYELKSAEGQLVVSDMIGRVIQTRQLTNSNGQITINDLPTAGIYFCTLIDGDKIADKRQIVLSK